MNRRKSNFILTLIFVIGVSLVLYPAVSNAINIRSQSKAIVEYEGNAKGMEEAAFSKTLVEAERYNRDLAKLDSPLRDHHTLLGYHDFLSMEGSDIMGFIEIDRIGVRLPIRHGTSEAVLNQGAGHLEGSSLPVGGTGSHSVLTAHSGLPSAELFTELDHLKRGDTFVITVFGRRVVYRVDEILIVGPEDSDALVIDEDKDYVTLLTCTPYGINSHRLLVRGARVVMPLPAVAEAPSSKVSWAHIAGTLGHILSASLAFLFFFLIMRSGRYAVSEKAGGMIPGIRQLLP